MIIFGIFATSNNLGLELAFLGVMGLAAFIVCYLIWVWVANRR